MKSFLLGLGMTLGTFDAQALGHLASIEVLNRDTGQVLPVYRAHGDCWIAGSPGARYAIVIRNAMAERVLAVTSVDGVNVISGETGAYEQTGYVFAPGQQYAIDGWRKSNQEIAAFNFTAVPDSYAARTGRVANVGVIGVALFLERPAPPPHDAPATSPGTDKSRAGAGDEAAEALSRAAPLERRAEGMQANQEASRLGTGHGAREYSYASNTAFERRTHDPGEIIRIRYDRYENLVAMGVIKARPLSPVPNPFPDSGQDRFVPDPPGP